LSQKIIEERTRRYLKPTNDSWRVDETYIKVNGEWKYLYRAVDIEGNTLDFMLSAKKAQKKEIFCLCLSGLSIYLA
jgi:transposase-like protein